MKNRQKDSFQCWGIFVREDQLYSIAGKKVVTIIICTLFDEEYYFLLYSVRDGREVVTGSRRM